MLKIEFFESGKGETIRITFPKGGIGIVDAHPATTSERPPIEALVKDRVVHFVCLTHPHIDHGSDLTYLFKSCATRVETFWHTLDDVSVFFLTTNQYPATPFQEVQKAIKQAWAEFLIELFHEATMHSDEQKCITSDLASIIIDDVEIIFLAPDSKCQKSTLIQYKQMANDNRPPDKKMDHQNKLSAVLGLKYKDNLVILGSDALKKQWNAINALAQKKNLPKAIVLKVPHHGAKNAYEKAGQNYLHLIRKGQSHCILFAGDIKHPHPLVYQELKKNSTVHHFHSFDELEDVTQVEDSDTYLNTFLPTIITGPKLIERRPLFHTITVQVSDGKCEVTKFPICSSVGGNGSYE